MIRPGFWRSRSLNEHFFSHLHSGTFENGLKKIWQGDFSKITECIEVLGEIESCM